MLKYFFPAALIAIILISGCTQQNSLQPGGPKGAEMKLCESTGGAWTECGSGCGPKTKEGEEGQINFSYKMHRWYFGKPNAEEADEYNRSVETYKKLNATMEYIGPQPERLMAYGEFKAAYFNGGFELEPQMCPAVCMPLCECSKIIGKETQKRYWDDEMGCIE